MPIPTLAQVHPRPHLDLGGRAGAGVFEYVRIERPEDLPPPDPRMRRRRRPGHEPRLAEPGPRLARPRRARRGLRPAAASLEETGLRVRALSFDVRRSGMIPEPPGRALRALPRHRRPGPHRPARRTTASPRAARASREDPAWEAPLFRLFDAILADPRARRCWRSATRFGVMCRWSGVARPVLRGRREGRQERGRPGERAHAGGAAASLVPPLRRGAARRPAAARRGQPALRPHPRPGAFPARRRCRSATRRAGVGGPARRGAHHDRVRARRRRA